MKSFFKFIFFSTLVLGALTLALGALLALNVLTPPSFSVSVNGTELPFEQMRAGHLALGTMGLLIAGTVVLVVVPLALLLGLAMPLLMLALGLSLGLMALLGVGALVLSPLLLIILALVWLSRRNRSKPSI